MTYIWCTSDLERDGKINIIIISVYASSRHRPRGSGTAGNNFPVPRRGKFVSAGPSVALTVAGADVA